MKYYCATCKCSALLFDSNALADYQNQVIGSEHKTESILHCNEVNGQMQVDFLLNTVYIAPPSHQSINNLIKCNACNHIIGETEQDLLKFDSSCIKFITSRYKSNVETHIPPNTLYTLKMISLQEELLELVDEFIESKEISELMTRKVDEKKNKK